MSKGEYDRKSVYEYAKTWAYLRNPQYYNYDLIGGDCTNFVSQCIFEGCKQMNYSKNDGWYYIDGNNKSPSWTGVEFLYKFLISNKGNGPTGRETTIDRLNIGDIIQLNLDGNKFSHSLVVVQNSKDIYNTLVAAHSFDTFGKKVAEYNYYDYRCIQIEY
ncbi:MAG: amidase [Clostridia bacterium]|nr:amidase [Clostridia bacterium]